MIIYLWYLKTLGGIIIAEQVSKLVAAIKETVRIIKSEKEIAELSTDESSSVASALKKLIDDNSLSIVEGFAIGITQEKQSSFSVKVVYVQTANLVLVSASYLAGELKRELENVAKILSVEVFIEIIGSEPLKSQDVSVRILSPNREN